MISLIYRYNLLYVFQFQDICNDDRRLDEIVGTIGPYRISKLDILTIAPILPKETKDQLRVKIDKETRWTVGWLNDQVCVHHCIHMKYIY